MEFAGDIVTIDDNPNNLRVLEGFLSAAGYHVRPALSGAIGLRAIQARLPDLVLLDIRMPEMDGYETCRHLKANAQTRDIPVIFISALNDIEDKLHAFRAGGVDYVIKPFQAEEVIARVRVHVELAAARRSLAESNARLNALMAQLVLAEKLKSLGALAAGIAHELNTPIGNALLAASTLEEETCRFLSRQENPSAEAQELANCSRECTGLILRSLERAGKLIGSMKEMVVDRASERRRQINLHQTVADFIAAMGILLKKTPYQISNAVDPALEIETYPGPLEQILDNLLQNAILHAFAGAAQGQIVIAAHANDAGGITLTFRDNGKGIPAKYLDQVFDPFFTTRLGQGGSGLGLHIVYNLVHGLLGGRVEIDSQEGAGTEIRLLLPRIAPTASTEKAP